MCGKLTITTNKMRDTRSGTKAKVQAEGVSMVILRKIKEDKKSINEDMPYRPGKNKTGSTSKKSTL